MTVVHICKYYYDSSVHRNLINNFSHYHKHDVKVLVGSHESEEEINENIFYCKYSSILRFFLFFRTLRVFWFSLRNSIFSDAKMVFCHTLVVDGALGYLAKTFFNIPYVIQVRNTDINFYYKKFPFYRPWFNLILRNASSVGFVSKANMNSFYALKGIADNLGQTYLWPNGVHDFWLEKNNNLPSNEPLEKNHLSFLYVGRFNENKNLRNVASAHERLLSLGYDVSIKYVGGSVEDFERCTGRNASGLRKSSIIEKLNMESLSEIYSYSTCLVVPSFFETFGLVYVESLSRNCPVICSIGQGIYGMFPESKSIKFVDPNSVDSIYKEMVFFINNELTISDFPSLTEFSWAHIGKNLYHDLERFL